MDLTNISLYLISDSSGETVKSFARAVITQFQYVKIEEHIWSYINQKHQIDQIFSNINFDIKNIIIHTMIDSDVRDYLFKTACKVNALCICPITHVTKIISDYINITPSRKVLGKSVFLEKSKYVISECVDFAIHHDDGMRSENYFEADIVLIGISRSCKTPTSLYMAQKGYKIANIPIILEDMDNEKNILNLFLEKYKRMNEKNIKKPIIIGLDISTDIVISMRQNRLNEAYAITSEPSHVLNSKYIQIDNVINEIKYAKSLFSKFDIDVVNVDYKAIEEISSIIIQIYIKKTKFHIENNFAVLN